jgi:hypothetical protein
MSKLYWTITEAKSKPLLYIYIISPFPAFSRAWVHSSFWWIRVAHLFVICAVLSFFALFVFVLCLLCPMLPVCSGFSILVATSDVSSVYSQCSGDVTLIVLAYTSPLTEMTNEYECRTNLLKHLQRKWTTITEAFRYRLHS